MMYTCSRPTKCNKPCEIPVREEGDACHIHRSSKYQEMNCMFKKELSVLHSKVKNYADKCQELEDQIAALQSYKDKIDFIERCDYIKYQVEALSPSRDPKVKVNLKAILRDYNNKDALERILDVPFRKAKERLFNLLDERNRICHKYTMANVFR